MIKDEAVYNKIRGLIMQADSIILVAGEEAPLEYPIEMYEQLYIARVALHEALAVLREAKETQQEDVAE